MQLHEFVSRVQQHAHIDDREQAMQATRATLETLSERIKGGEPLDLASQLPQQLQQYLHEGQGERFGADEFYRRVAEREGVDPDEARGHAEAVLRVVGEAVSEGEVRDLLAQLPEEYRALISAARRPS